MAIPTPTVPAEAISLRDLPPLPIFAYVPSVAVWLVVVGLLLVVAWIVLRAPRRRATHPNDALNAVEEAIERCLSHGVTREDVFLVSRAVKILLRTRYRGDFTAETPGELRLRSRSAVSSPLGHVLSILAELDESKYRPDRATLEGSIRELRGLLRPLLEPPSSATLREGGTA